MSLPTLVACITVKTGTTTAQSFFPGNGAIFVPEIMAVICTVLNSRAVRPETRQMPILALLPLWIADAFTYCQTECQFFF